MAKPTTDVWVCQVVLKSFDLVNIKVTGPRRPLESMLQALSLRQTSAWQLASRFPNPDNILLSYQLLCWVLEYCRATRRSKLQVECVDCPEQSREFDLTLLIATPRECQAIGCHKETALACVSCSRCLVAVWCSPMCLEQDYKDHKALCDFGHSARTALGL